MYVTFPFFFRVDEFEEESDTELTLLSSLTSKTKIVEKKVHQTTEQLLALQREEQVTWIT